MALQGVKIYFLMPLHNSNSKIWINYMLEVAALKHIEAFSLLVLQDFHGRNFAIPPRLSVTPTYLSHRYFFFLRSY